jgi:hypothetical protein
MASITMYMYSYFTTYVYKTFQGHNYINICVLRIWRSQSLFLHIPGNCDDTLLKNNAIFRYFQLWKGQSESNCLLI